VSPFQSLASKSPCLLNHKNPFLKFIFAVSLAQRSFLWPCLHANRPSSVVAISNCTPTLLAHSMVIPAHLSSMVMTWLTSLPVALQPTFSTKDCRLAETYLATTVISTEVKITERIGDNAEPSCAAASTGCLSIALSSIIISKFLAESVVSIHHIRSRSISLILIQLTSLPVHMLGKAAIMSMTGMSVVWPYGIAA